MTVHKNVVGFFAVPQPPQPGVAGFGGTVGTFGVPGVTGRVCFGTVILEKKGFTGLSVPVKFIVGRTAEIVIIAVFDICITCMVTTFI